jgi:hypothetical protein
MRGAVSTWIGAGDVSERDMGAAHSRSPAAVKRSILFLCLVLAGVVLWFLNRARMFEPAMDVVEYQSQIFKLTRSYRDYDDYKNDPDNLDPSENARVERAVAEARVAGTFRTREDMIHAAVFDLRFPGYGLTSLEDVQPDGSTLACFRIEIPRAGKDRVMVFRGQDKARSLIDDFIALEKAAFISVTERDGALVYSAWDGSPVFVRPLAK